MTTALTSKGTSYHEFRVFPPWVGYPPSPGLGADRNRFLHSLLPGHEKEAPVFRARCLSSRVSTPMSWMAVSSKDTPPEFIAVTQLLFVGKPTVFPGNADRPAAPEEEVRRS